MRHLSRFHASSVTVSCVICHGLRSEVANFMRHLSRFHASSVTIAAIWCIWSDVSRKLSTREVGNRGFDVQNRDR